MMHEFAHSLSLSFGTPFGVGETMAHPDFPGAITDL